MPVNPSTTRWGYDSLLVFRDRGLAALTTTTATPAILLDRLISYWNAGDQAQNLQSFVAVEVENLSGTITTLNATVQVGTGAGFTSPAAVAALDLPQVAGVYLIPIARERIVQASATADRIRVNFTIAGTTPTAGLNAYLTQVLGH